MAIEIKHRRALLLGTSPFDTYQPTDPLTEKKSAQRKHVEQIYGYLHRNGE